MYYKYSLINKKTKKEKIYRKNIIHNVKSAIHHCKETQEYASLNEIIAKLYKICYIRNYVPEQKTDIIKIGIFLTRYVFILMLLNNMICMQKNCCAKFF